MNFTELKLSKFWPTLNLEFVWLALSVAIVRFLLLISIPIILIIQTVIFPYYLNYSYKYDNRCIVCLVFKIPAFNATTNFSSK